MYTKQNFQIAKIAAKQDSRFALSAVHVTPTETRVCDSVRLVRVKVKQDSEFEPFLMSAAQALDAAKHAGKTGAVFAPDTHVNGHVTVQAGPVTLTADKPKGRFPEIDRVIPKVDETWHKVTFDIKLLRELLEIHAGSGKHATMYFKDVKSPMLMETTKGDGPDVQSALMPYRDDNARY
jgi:DNA polymerase III sliding clamp (beta) subunit (PCNA family)